jgi:hypothetical protein
MYLGLCLIHTIEEKKEYKSISYFILYLSFTPSHSIDICQAEADIYTLLCHIHLYNYHKVDVKLYPLLTNQITFFS